MKTTEGHYVNDAFYKECQLIFKCENSLFVMKAALRDNWNQGSLWHHKTNHHKRKTRVCNAFWKVEKRAYSN